jgi:hypothetical protein
MNHSCRFVPQLFISLICLILAVPGFVQGTTQQKLAIDQLTDEADLVVRGRVEGVKIRQAPDRRSVSTVVSVSVKKQFKGPEVSSVTVEQPGGAMGDVVQVVPGLAEFSQGEDVVLFLNRQRGGVFNTVNGKQGKFTIKTQAETGTEIVEDFAHRAEALDSFLGRVKTMINAPR